MTTPLTEQDQILLNAYLDDELAARERANLESRLAKDETLQAELESLRATAALLGMAQRVRVPRNFTLDPAVYGKPALSNWWANLQLPAIATAGVTILVMLCIGAVLLRSQSGGMAPQAVSLDMPVAEAPIAEELAAEATEAPAEEASEATEASGDAQYAPTEAAEEAESMPANTFPPLPTATSTHGQGMDSGPSQATSSEVEGGVTGVVQPTPTMAQIEETEERATAKNATTTLPPAPAVGSPVVAEAAASMQPPGTDREYITENDAGDSSASDALTQPNAYTTTTAVSTPAQGTLYVWGLPIKLIASLVGIVVLVGALISIGIALKRRRQ